MSQEQLPKDILETHDGAIISADGDVEFTGMFADRFSDNDEASSEAIVQIPAHEVAQVQEVPFDASNIGHLAAIGVIVVGGGAIAYLNLKSRDNPERKNQQLDRDQD